MSHHHHDHHHQHESSKLAEKTLWLGIFLSFFMFIVEIIGGMVSNSLALLSDAGHLFADNFSLILALIALKVSQKKPNDSYPFGFERTTVFAALINSITLMFIAIYICYEAYHRFIHPEPVKGAVVFVIAVVGLVINLIMAKSMHGHSDNINIKGALLHVLGDALASIGVIISSLILWFTPYTIADPIISVVISILIFIGVIPLFKETIHIFMEAKPKKWEQERFLKEIQESFPKVEVENLKVWSLTSHKNCMNISISIYDCKNIQEYFELKEKLEHIAEHHYGISELTIQLNKKKTL